MHISANPYPTTRRPPGFKARRPVSYTTVSFVCPLVRPPQRAGLSLSATARELQVLLSSQQHLAAGLAAVRQLRRLLARCCQVGRGPGAEWDGVRVS